MDFNIKKVHLVIETYPSPICRGLKISIQHRRLVKQVIGTHDDYRYQGSSTGYPNEYYHQILNHTEVR